MANTMGALVVKLALDAAEFVTGLTKAEHQSQKFAKQMETNFKSAAKFIGTLGIGTAVGLFIRNTIDAAAALDDLSDATGSSVESLSKLANQAKISGRSIDELQAPLLKLAAGMGGADDESKKVKDALALLGISTRDPAQALTEVALAFEKFKDGANKAALAKALFSKDGPAFLATLKDIAKLGEVAATVSEKQAGEAEKLQQAWRRLSVEGTTLKNTVLQLTGPLADYIEQWKKAHEVFGAGGTSALFQIGALQLGGLRSEEDVLADIQERIKGITEDTSLEAKWAKALGITDSTLERLKKAREFLQLVQRQNINATYAGQDFSDQVSRGAAGRPDAPTLPPTDAAIVLRARLEAQLKAVERYVKEEEELFKDREHFLAEYYQDDVIGIDRYFGERQKALDAAIQLERVAFDEREKLLRAFQPDDEKERIAIEEKIADAIAKKTKAEREYINLSADAIIERTRAQKAFNDSIEQTSIALAAARGDTVGAVAKAFDLQYRDQIKRLQNNGVSTAEVEALRKQLINQAELTKATQEYNLTMDELGVAQQRINNAADVGAISELEALRQRSSATDSYILKLRVELAAVEAIALASGKREDAVRVMQLKVQLEALADQTDLVTKKMNDGLGRAFADNLIAVADGTKTLREGIKGLEKDIIHMLNEIAVNELKTALFGKGGGLSGVGGWLASLFGGGAGSTGGLPTGANGIPAFASGTNFAPGGWAKVGEYGTEIVNMPRGAQVIPHDKLVAAREARSGNITVMVEMPRGASRQTGAQFGAEAARSIQQSFGRNG